MILLLRNIGQENLEAVVQGDVVILIFLHDPARCFDDFLSFLGIAGLCGAQCGHLHVRAHFHVVTFHGVHGMGPGVRVGTGVLPHL